MSLNYLRMESSKKISCNIMQKLLIMKNTEQDPAEKANHLKVENGR